VASWAIRWLITAVVGWLGSAPAAWAQDEPLDGRDLTGIALPPPSGHPARPLLSWAPLDDGREWTFSVVGEVAARTASRFEFRRDSRVAEEAAAFERFGRLLLGGQVDLGRIAVGATLPLVLNVEAGDLDQDGLADGGGAALGDLTVWVPAAIVPASEGPGLSLIPYATLPTGSTARFTGDPGVALGALAVAGYGQERWRIDGTLGLELSPRNAGLLQEYGGVGVPFALGAGVEVADGDAAQWWLGAELRGHADLGAREIEVPDTPIVTLVSATPIEVFATLRARLGQADPAGGFVVSGGGAGVTSGLGAARAGRFVVGAGLRGTLDAIEPPPFVVEAVDPTGTPIAGATVSQGSRSLGQTDALGRLEVVARPGRALEIRAPGFEPASIALATVDERVERVRLAWSPRDVPIRVTDEDGTLLAPRWTARSVDDERRIDGTGSIALPPGRWRVEVEAEGLAGQARQVRVPARGAPPGIDVVLLPPQGLEELALRIADVDDEGVEGAQVLIDGRVVGTTGDGGVVVVSQLTRGRHRVEVQHPDYTTAVVDRSTGDSDTVVLSRQKGSVRVTVRDPGGSPVTDAVARFVGPRRLPPLPLGERGQRVLVLRPGAWTLLVSSATYGVQQRAIDVPEDGWELIDVGVVLQRREAGRADVVIRVQDRRGQPVDGALLRLDEQDLGSVSTGGTLALSDLTVGRRVLEVSGEGLRPMEPRVLELVPGLQEAVVEVAWEPGLVDVIARSPEGPVRDGVVRFLGPEPRPPLPLTPQGRQRVTLSPGAWTVLLTSQTYGAQQRRVDIAVDSDVRHVVEFVVSPAEGGDAALGVTITDPRGRPVDGARVSLDAQPVGTTSNTGQLRIEGLTTGRRTLDVEAPMYASVREEVELSAGLVERSFVLGWAAAVVRAAVVRDGQPVPDAVVRFFGERRAAPRPVSTDGRTITQLSAGRWTVLATSPTAGVGEASLIVPDGPGLTDVTVEVAPAARDRTDLVVRVTDPLGRPVDGAEVRVASTAPIVATDGVAILRNLPRQTLPVTVSAPGFAAIPAAGVALDGARIEHLVELPFVEVPLVVRAQTGDGAPVAGARIRVEGPLADVDLLVTDAAGRAEARVPPGRWTIIAARDALSVAETVDVGLDGITAPVRLTLTEGGARRETTGVEIEQRVAFDFNEATLRPGSRPVLEAVALIIRSDPTIIEVEVQGHTDNLGTADVNQRLSELRAEVVVDELVALGVAPEKLTSRGYGRRRPVADNARREGRALNRRVQFVIVEQSPAGDASP